MEAVVTSDWHLDVLNSIYSTNIEEGIQLQIKDIQKSFEFAMDEGILTVIVAGDIGQRCELSAVAKYHLLNLLLQYDNVLHIHLILGNHDYHRNGVHSLSLVELLCTKHKFSTVFLYTSPTQVTIEGERFYFLPFPHTEGREDCINIAHLEPTGAVRDNGHLIRKGHQLSGQWVIGHLHQYQKLAKAVLPGTLYQCNFGEKLPKGFIQLTVKQGEVSHRFIQITPSFTFTTVQVDTVEDWKQLSKRDTDFYRVYTAPNLTVPEDIYHYRNILQISGTQFTPTDTNTQMVQALEDDPEVLHQFLKTFNLDKYQLKRAKVLISEANHRCCL